MARIKGVTEIEANDEVRQIFAAQKKRHGFVSNAAQVPAVRPTIQKGVQALAKEFRNQDLYAGAAPPGLRKDRPYQWLPVLN
jgi:hypothetical protein